MHNVRRLTAESIADYRDWLKKGATGPAPSQLLTDAGVCDWFFLFYINALAPLAAERGHPLVVQAARIDPPTEGTMIPLTCW